MSRRGQAGSRAARQSVSRIPAAGGRLLGLGAVGLTLALVSLSPGAAASASQVARSAGSPHFTVYSVLTAGQYINVADDRDRGEGNNPFGNYSGSAAPAPSNEKLFGPLPGDLGDFSFNLYGSAAHTTRLGTALFICHYNFDQGGDCDVAFQLSNGTLIGKGPYNFDASTFTLPIVGGTDAYRGSKGEVSVVALGIATQAQPVHRAVPMLQAQRLTFSIKSLVR
jgi:hypothetical protein